MDASIAHKTVDQAAENKEKLSAKERWLKMASDSEITPMMAQFCTIKSEHPDALLFYRMGDFYELFFTDAEQAANALDITLTKRGKHGGNDIPMAGVPVHAAEMYLSRLIKAGFRVAVCEQTEDPAEAKKRGSKSVVRREIIRLVTPGTLTEDALLSAEKHNYLIALGRSGGRGKSADFSLAAVDMSTGDLIVIPIAQARLEAELARLDGSEILVPEDLYNDELISRALFDWRSRVTWREKNLFDSNRATERLKAAFQIDTLDGLGDFSRADLSALGALLGYIADTQKGQMPRLKRPTRENTRAVMMIDAATRRSLELVRTQTGETRGSLLATIDRTITGAGARELAARLSSPLTNPDAINARLDFVEFYTERPNLVHELKTHLKSTPDIERSLARLSLERGGPRDIYSVGVGLNSAMAIARDIRAAVPDLSELPQLAREGLTALEDHHQIRDLLAQALVTDPPILIRDGGFIASGYHAGLDEHRTLRDESRRLIAGLESQYRTDTGISALKIKHNNVLGYHVDVPARHADKLMSEPFDSQFIHRQTLANSVRFSTTDLAELAGRISRAGEQALALEQQIFEELRTIIMDDVVRISEAAKAIGDMDVAIALAVLASENHYSRPVIDDSHAFAITGGRHPVVEASIRSNGAKGGFVANDCDLSPDRRLWLMTGPNMAGKSTFLRQNALIAIMAQMGGFVPAQHAHIGCVDRLFSRVGASDDLAHGRSTFMVEMVETAAILNQAGPRSLVILDEIGRGTATYDGLSIAWAAVEHLHNINQSRALFATHYHEMTALKETLESLTLRSMKVREYKGDVIFLHEVGQGAADRSYGIQVAKLAGLPNQVVNRARQVLTQLENTDGGTKQAIIDDLPLFSSVSDEAASTISDEPSVVETALADIDPDQLTPREALDKLYALKDLADAND